MKHLLNDLSEIEKNSIREQYTDKINVKLSKFKKLVKTKLGDVKPLVEQTNGNMESDLTKKPIDKERILQELDDEFGKEFFLGEDYANESSLGFQEFLYWLNDLRSKHPNDIETIHEIIDEYRMKLLKKMARLFLSQIRQALPRLDGETYRVTFLQLQKDLSDSLQFELSRRALAKMIQIADSELDYIKDYSL